MQSRTTTAPLPYFYVGKDLTAQRISNYTDKHTLLSTALGKPDTKCVWYSREHIEKLLEEIDHAGGDGLRVFLGAYESGHAEFAGQTCLLMTVTRQAAGPGNTIIHENVVLEDEPDYGDRSVLERVIPEWIIESQEVLGQEKDFNHGSPCPPACDGDGGIDFP